MKTLRTLLPLVLLIALATLTTTQVTTAANGPSPACAGVDDYVAAYAETQAAFQTIQSPHADIWDKDAADLTPSELATMAEDARWVAEHLAALPAPPALAAASALDTAFWFTLAAFLDTASAVGVPGAVAVYGETLDSLISLTGSVTAVAVSECPAAGAIYGSASEQA